MNYEIIIDMPYKNNLLEILPEGLKIKWFERFGGIERVCVVGDSVRKMGELAKVLGEHYG